VEGVPVRWIFLRENYRKGAFVIHKRFEREGVWGGGCMGVLSPECPWGRDEVNHLCAQKYDVKKEKRGKLMRPYRSKEDVDCRKNEGCRDTDLVW